MTFGQRLRLERKERKLSQSAMANAVGCSKSAINMYERDERIPRDSEKIKFARFFDTTVGALFFNEIAH